MHQVQRSGKGWCKYMAQWEIIELELKEVEIAINIVSGMVKNYTKDKEKYKFVLENLWIKHAKIKRKLNRLSANKSA